LGVEDATVVDADDGLAEALADDLGDPDALALGSADMEACGVAVAVAVGLGDGLAEEVSLAL
jgi:hypothetical protein